MSVDSLLEHAEPLLLPVGQLLSTFDAERRWPEHRQARVRIGRTPHELTEPEYRVWSLAHGVIEAIRLQPWTVRRVVLTATGAGVHDAAGIVTRLTGRGLLVEVGPGTDDRTAFARRFRLVPLTAGLGNPDPDHPERFKAGWTAALGADLDPVRWLVWRWAATDVDLMSTCEYVGDALGDDDPPGPGPVEVVHSTVHALHPMLAHGAAYLDERWTRPPLPWEPLPPPERAGLTAATLFAIGHSGGPVYLPDGDLHHYDVRIGRVGFELSETEYQVWRQALERHGQPGRPYTRDDLVARLARDELPAEYLIDDLLARGLLAEVDPGDGGRAFAARYRLRNQHAGIGFDRMGRYDIGQVAHQRARPFAVGLIAQAPAAEVDIWQWCGECADLWELATLVTTMNSGRGRTGAADVDPDRYLAHVYEAAGHLLDLGACYLDAAMPG